MKEAASRFNQASAAARSPIRSLDRWPSRMTFAESIRGDASVTVRSVGGIRKSAFEEITPDDAFLGARPGATWQLDGGAELAPCGLELPVEEESLTKVCPALSFLWFQLRESPTARRRPDRNRRA